MGGRIGRYELCDRLGHGGMAEVWRAKMVGAAGFERAVVIKRILPHLVDDPDLVRMFVSEARLSARLSHSNIVQVFELGESDGEYFLAMEYVHGHDLLSLLREYLTAHGAPPPVAMSAFVLREVCAALSYAHDSCGERVVHRDVSPSNVMLSFDGGVKLLDFGIAKALDGAGESRTQTGVLKGKVGYLAPEVIDGAPIDHRVDIFAAGVVLHELLTGRRLFRGDNDLHSMQLVSRCEIAAPSASNPNVPAELDRICLRALARDPRERYQSADEMARDLDGVVARARWSRARTAQLLDAIFPGEATSPKQRAATAAEVASSRSRQGHARREALLLGIFLAALLAVVPLLGRAPVPATTAAAIALPDAAPPAIAAPAAPLPSTVKVRVNANREGASVYLDGERIGQSPVELTLPRGERPVRLAVRARRHATRVLELVPDRDARLEVTLTPEWAVPFSPHAAAQHK